MSKSCARTSLNNTTTNIINTNFENRGVVAAPVCMHTYPTHRTVNMRNDRRIASLSIWMDPNTYEQYVVPPCQGWESYTRVRYESMLQLGGVERWDMRQAPRLACFNLHPTDNFYYVGYQMVIEPGGCLRRPERDFHAHTGYWPEHAHFCRIYHWRPFWGHLTEAHAQVVREMQTRCQQRAQCCSNASQSVRPSCAQ